MISYRVCASFISKSFTFPILRRKPFSPRVSFVIPISSYTLRSQLHCHCSKLYSIIPKCNVFHNPTIRLNISSSTLTHYHLFRSCYLRSKTPEAWWVAILLTLFGLFSSFTTGLAEETSITCIEFDRYPWLAIDEREAWQCRENVDVYRSLCIIWRICQILLAFLPCVLLSPIVCVMPSMKYMWWNQVKLGLEHLGGCWLKFGQWASTRPDLFSKDSVESLQNLCYHCPGHSYDSSLKQLKQAYGDDVLDTLFSSFSEDYIASGAMAQVHTAILRSGEKVAVKILHPSIVETVELDLQLLKMLVSLFKLFPQSQWWGMENAIAQFSKSMRDQVDLEKEYKNLIRFNQQFSGHPFVGFPKVFDNLSRRNVLIESFEEGQLLSSFLHQPSTLSKNLAKVGIDVYMTMMLKNNFVHADLHPGNILIQKKKRGDEGDRLGVKNYKMVLLDVGLVTECSDRDFNNFRGMFKAILKGEGEVAAKMMIDSSTGDSLARDTDIFIKEMGAILNSVRGVSLKDIEVGLFLLSILGLARKHKVLIEGNFATLCVATAVIEGIGKQLDPDIQFLSAAVPYLVKK